mmetsp:Transcript_1437/g.4542  ORF Transcript_1437/g.4542 Transcript_1437/m.4542 type:complete len:268 (+) Transcript_1437:2276-3079(+)
MKVPDEQVTSVTLKIVEGVRSAGRQRKVEGNLEGVVGRVVDVRAHIKGGLAVDETLAEAGVRIVERRAGPVANLDGRRRARVEFDARGRRHKVRAERLRTVIVVVAAFPVVHNVGQLLRLERLNNRLRAVTGRDAVEHIKDNLGRQGLGEGTARHGAQRGRRLDNLAGVRTTDQRLRHVALLGLANEANARLGNNASGRLHAELAGKASHGRVRLSSELGTFVRAARNAKARATAAGVVSALDATTGGPKAATAVVADAVALNLLGR